MKEVLDSGKKLEFDSAKVLSNGGLPAYRALITERNYLFSTSGFR